MTAVPKDAHRLAGTLMAVAGRARMQMVSLLTHRATSYICAFERAYGVLMLSDSPSNGSL